MTDTGDMELLEREPSLALLAGYAAEARRGDGRLVVLGGEAGVGKTTLLERFQRDLRDARWSWGACDGLFTPRPLGPLYDLADQLGGELLDLCARGASRDELFRALLRQVSGPGPVNVVVVEDIHWADEATMDLLRFAGRRLRDTRVLLIVTFRDDDLATDDQLRVALGELARHRTTRRIALAPLSADAVRALAGGSSLEAAALYQLTGGNPFYVTEVLRAGMAEVPASARDAVLARAAGLGADARQLLEVAALTGARVEADLLEATAGCPRRPSTSCWRAGCSPPTADGCGSGTRSPGWRWSRPSRRAAARRSTASSSPPCARPGHRTRRRWPFTPRKRTTSRRCCGTRPRRRAGRPRWRRTGRPSRSWSGRCGSRPGHQGSSPSRSRACTTSWPSS